MLGHIFFSLILHAATAYSSATEIVGGAERHESTAASCPAYGNGCTTASETALISSCYPGHATCIPKEYSTLHSSSTNTSTATVFVPSTSNQPGGASPPTTSTTDGITVAMSTICTVWNPTSSIGTGYLNDSSAAHSSAPCTMRVSPPAAVTSGSITTIDSVVNCMTRVSIGTPPHSHGTTGTVATTASGTIPTSTISTGNPSPSVGYPGESSSNSVSSIGVASFDSTNPGIRTQAVSAAAALLAIGAVPFVFL